jgi:hypothetical protein
MNAKQTSFGKCLCKAGIFAAVLLVIVSTSIIVHFIEARHAVPGKAIDMTISTSTKRREEKSQNCEDIALDGKLRIFVTDVVAGAGCRGFDEFSILVCVMNIGQDDISVDYTKLEWNVADMDVCELESGELRHGYSLLPSSTKIKTFNITIPAGMQITLAFSLPTACKFITPDAECLIEFRHPAFDQDLSWKFYAKQVDGEFYFTRASE